MRNEKPQDGKFSEWVMWEAFSKAEIDQMPDYLLSSHKKVRENEEARRPSNNGK